MKITLFFITFLGINTGYAQKPLALADSVIVSEPEQKAIAKNAVDSLKSIVGPSVHLYPNPAKNRVEINIKGFVPGLAQVELIDNYGRRVKRYTRNVFSGNEIIVLMFSEKPGIYFISMKQGSISLRSRLVIR